MKDGVDAFITLINFYILLSDFSGISFFFIKFAND